MPLAPAFTITTPVPINTTSFILTDTSTGSDGTIVGRQILLYTAAGTLYNNLAPIPWALATNPITISPLIADVSLNVVVNWVNSSGATVVTTSLIYAFNANGELFYYQLTQAQSSNPSIIQDQSYYYWKMVLRVELDSSQQAISVGQDLSGSNQCIVRYQQLLNNESYYFGAGAQIN